jgi:hypothetical protein
MNLTPCKNTEELNLKRLLVVSRRDCRVPPYHLDFSYDLLCRMLAEIWLPSCAVEVFLRRSLFKEQFLSPTSKLPFSPTEQSDLVLAGTQGLLRLPVPNYGAINCEVITDLPLLKVARALPCDLIVSCKLRKTHRVLGVNFWVPKSPLR